MGAGPSTENQEREKIKREENRALQLQIAEKNNEKDKEIAKAKIAKEEKIEKWRIESEERRRLEVIRAQLIYRVVVVVAIVICVVCCGNTFTKISSYLMCSALKRVGRMEEGEDMPKPPSYGVVPT